MTSNATSLPATEDDARIVAGHLGFLTEAQLARLHEIRIGERLYGGFARDFATSDGERVMVAALTRRQFAELAQTTSLASIFAFLERLLDADFSALRGRVYPSEHHRRTARTVVCPAQHRRSGSRVRRNLGAVGTAPRQRSAGVLMMVANGARCTR